MTMKKQFGFTLIELMMALVIAAILLAVGVPSLRMFIQNNKIIAARDDLRSGLFLARSMAVKDNLTGCVCSASNINAPACDGGANWETGWIAFLNVAGNCEYAAGNDVLLKVYDGSKNAPGEFAIRSDDASINANNYVRFNSRGIPQQINGAGQRGNFTICDDRGVPVDANGDSVARAIILSPSGATRDTRHALQVTACPF